MRGQITVQALGLLPGQIGAQNLREVALFQLREPRDAVDLIGQPRAVGGELRVGPVRPGAGVELAQPGDAGLQLAGGLAPVEARQIGGGRQGGGDLMRLGGLGAVLQHQRAEPAAAAGEDGAGGRIKPGLHRYNAAGEQRFGVERCGQCDSCGELHLQAGNREEFGLGELVVEGNLRPTAAGQPEAAGLATALGHAVRETGGNQRAGIAIRSRIAHAEPPPIAQRGTANARDRAPIGVHHALQRAKPQRDIGGFMVAQRVTFFQQGREVAGQCCLRLGCCGQHHRGEAGMRAQTGHAPAQFGELPALQRAKFGQQGLPGRDSARRWRVGEGQIGRGSAPCRAIQGEAG